MTIDIEIRAYVAADAPAIREINRQAFRMTRPGAFEKLLPRSDVVARVALNCPFCIVVGHAGYYPRFGFARGSLHGLRCQWDKVPDASFMVCVLDEQAMQDVSGTARYIAIE